MKSLRGVAAALAALAILAADARAQWDAPSFLPPRPGDDIGVYFSEIGDWGIQGIWRQGGTLNLGVRLGYIDTDSDGLLTVGAETWFPLVRAGEDLPVDLTASLGAGATINGATEAAVPVGLSIGRLMDLGPLAVQVYGHPRVALVFQGDGDPPGEDDGDIDIDALLDLGIDVAISETLKLRVAATAGDRDGLGIGLAYRWTRGAQVR